MKALSVSFIAAVLAFGMLGAGCKQETPAPAVKPAPTQTTVSAKTAAPEEFEIAQKFCPVTGEPINPKIYADYKGWRVYFCCSMCPATFRADPEKYLRIVEQELAGGEMPRAPKPAATASPATSTATTGNIAYWTCPMHPEVKSDKPGKCPRCSMALEPVRE